MSGWEVVDLGPAEREEAVDVLVAAFRDYPVMRFVLGSPDAGHEARLRALVGFYVDVRLGMGWPVLGVRDGTRLVGVTLANPPSAAPFLERFEEGLARLREEIGDDAYARAERYETESEGEEPQAPHWFVGMVGVRPGRQGRGIGRALLGAVHARADADGVGVLLCTEDASNLPIYRRLGYGVRSEIDVGPMRSWAMWRAPRRGTE